MFLEQAHLDVSVCELLSKMNEVFTFLTATELKAIESMKTIVDRITHQTLECSHFIQAYCANQKFRELTYDAEVDEFTNSFQGTRLLKNLVFSEARSEERV